MNRPNSSTDYVIFMYLQYRLHLPDYSLEKCKPCGRAYKFIDLCVGGEANGEGPKAHGGGVWRGCTFSSVGYGAIFKSVQFGVFGVVCRFFGGTKRYLASLFYWG